MAVSNFGCGFFNAQIFGFAICFLFLIVRNLITNLYKYVSQAARVHEKFLFYHGDVIPFLDVVFGF